MKKIIYLASFLLLFTSNIASADLIFAPEEERAINHGANFVGNNEQEKLSNEPYLYLGLLVLLIVVISVVLLVIIKNKKKNI